MSSSVYFKFKSQKEPTRVEFDGTGISVFELKRDIIVKSGLGDGTDFDLAIYTEDGKDEYDDDTTIIPRSTTVIARRLAPMKPGAGRAARYVSGKMPANAKNASRREQTTKSTAKAASSAIEQMNNAMTEEEKLAAMFAAQSEQWNAQQEEMSHQTPIFKPGAGGARRPANVPDHDPPNGYVCYRCGEKGHWIQMCPTNDNPEFDNRPRVKRTTGIPRSFLKTVDKAAILAQAAEDDTKTPSGIMVNADGDYVIAEPDKASWEKFQAKTKSGAAAQEVAARADKELQERGLECSIDKKLFLDPMKTPCCERTYCNDCITNALIESDFICPGCQSEGVLIDDLKPDEATEQKVQAYQKEKAEGGLKKKVDDEKTSKDGSNDAAATATSPKEPGSGVRKSPSPSGQTPTPAQSTFSAKPGSSTESTGASATNGTKPSSPPKTGVDGGESVASSGDQLSNAKKRPAGEEADNPKIPKAPKVMQQQQQHSFPLRGGGYGMNGMNGMNGLNGMNGMPVMPMPGMLGMPGMAGMPMGNMGNMGGMGMMPYGGMPMMNYGMGPMGMNPMGMGGMGGMGNMGNMGNMNMMNPMMGMNGGGGYGGNGYQQQQHRQQQGWGNGGGYGNQGAYSQQRFNGYGNGNQGPVNVNNNNGKSNIPAAAANGPANGAANGPTNGAANGPTNGAANGTANGNDNAATGQEEDAYFRKPVNPNRHFNKVKRIRPSDYREL